MKFFNIKKISRLCLTLLILSQYTYACDSFVVLGKDGRIAVMKSGDPYSCPRINVMEMVKEWCNKPHEDQTEKDLWLKACDEYFKRKEPNWFYKSFGKSDVVIKEISRLSKTTEE